MPFAIVHKRDIFQFTPPFPSCFKMIWKKEKKASTPNPSHAHYHPQNILNAINFPLRDDFYFPFTVKYLLSKFLIDFPRNFFWSCFVFFVKLFSMEKISSRIMKWKKAHIKVLPVPFHDKTHIISGSQTNK